MTSRTEMCDDDDLWSKFVSADGEEQSQDDPTHITVVYTRRKADGPRDPPPIIQSPRPPRVSFAPPAKRTSWNRSLNTRGRKSITVAAGLEFIPMPKQMEAKKKPKQGLSKKRSGKQNHPMDYRKEIAYFEEVDAVELLEESPSPKQFGTWAMGTKASCNVPDLSTILERWHISKLAYSCRPSGILFDILETPFVESSCSEVSSTFCDRKSEQTLDSSAAQSTISSQRSITSKFFDGNSTAERAEKGILQSFDALRITNDACQHSEALSKGEDGVDTEANARKDSLTSRLSSLSGERRGAFAQLLNICRQSEPLSLSEVFSKICDPSDIAKMGEGTYGEAFKAGASICKIVPIDGDSLVNGEVQKRSEEVLEEVMLSLTLNTLRGQDGTPFNQNMCTSFIETRDFQVCQGPYGDALISAWEDWDAEHGSENDNPKEFSEKQCYIVFILAHGGRDLERFVLLNFDEARSLLAQVAAALAVAEVACEFEHRDLHWGNVLLTRKDVETLDFSIQGRKLHVNTYGLLVSIIDFTLSRIKVGESILFLDLSSDPALFEGPKGDKQSETYRKMKEITEDCWEGSFPKTNALWLQYLVDILLLKKSFKRTKNDERDLRSLKKRLSSYNSARDSLADSFFTEIMYESATQ